tara:strand:+ start:840 stop:1292 length:453 start_codon:yes stop_codon:yes gene_type:complete
MSETINFDDVVEKLDADGIMQEPDANWIIEYMASEYGGSLDTTSDFVDNKYDLKIYSESTYDGYDIYWCTIDDKPHVCQDGYYYEDYTEWSERAIEHITQGGNVWIESHIWDDMEYDFNLELQQWWEDVYDELHREKIDELVDDGYEYED